MKVLVYSYVCGKARGISEFQRTGTSHSLGIPRVTSRQREPIVPHGQWDRVQTKSSTLLIKVRVHRSYPLNEEEDIRTEMGQRKEEQEKTKICQYFIDKIWQYFGTRSPVTITDIDGSPENKIRDTHACLYIQLVHKNESGVSKTGGQKNSVKKIEKKSFSYPGLLVSDRLSLTWPWTPRSWSSLKIRQGLVVGGSFRWMWWETISVIVPLIRVTKRLMTGWLINWLTFSVQLIKPRHTTFKKMSLVLDLLIAHDRFGSNSGPSLNGHLHYPNDIDKSLTEVATDKVQKYRVDYNNNPPTSVSFIPLI